MSHDDSISCSTAVSNDTQTHQRASLCCATYARLSALRVVLSANTKMACTQSSAARPYIANTGCSDSKLWTAPALGRGRFRDWRVRFKEDEREELERLLSLFDEKREERQDKLKKGKPSNLQELARAIHEATIDTQIGHKGSNIRVNPVLPAFTRRREVFAGRFAMVGFVMACFWETILPSHPGILNQVSYATGLSPPVVGMFVLLLMTWNAVGGLAPWSPTWSLNNMIDVLQRPPGPPMMWLNPLKHPLMFLGLSSTRAPYKWGFNRKNELFHGRLAMLGFLGSLINEVKLGGIGPVAQVAHLLDRPADEGFYALAANSFVVFCLIVIALSFTVGASGFMQGEEEIY